MPTPSAGHRVLALGLLLASATAARAVDVTGPWAVCLSLNAGFLCPTTLTATLVGSSATQFTMTFGPPASCSVSGTVDGNTGAMTGSGSCIVPGVGYFSGTATDTTMSGTMGLSGSLCAYQFDGVRPCPACDDGGECTTDGCGATACSAPSSTCTHAEATPGSACSDGYPCTNGDHCQGTTCMGYPVNCSDNNPCTDEFCDPSIGACVFVPNTNPCNDGNACTVGDTCSGGHCAGGTPRVCQPCERCGPLVGCVVGPKTGCRTPIDPTRSQITLRNSGTDAGDKLQWKWTGQATTAADLGDPVTTDDYTLCVFDQTTTTPRLLLASTAPAASTCPFGPTGAPCWRALGTPPGAKGFSYRNRGLFSPDGLARVKLTPGPSGRAKASVKGQGANLGMPSPLDVTPPVQVQLQAENGQCWEATYTAAQLDREDVFKAKGGN